MYIRLRGVLSASDSNVGGERGSPDEIIDEPRIDTCRTIYQLIDRSIIVLQ